MSTATRGGAAQGVPIQLFSPYRLLPGGSDASSPGVPLRNRIVFPAITTGFVGPQGEVTDRFLAWYRARSAGGAALIVTEPAQVSALGGRYRRRLRADTDDALPTLRRLAAAVQADGAKALLQLNHYGSRLPRDVSPASNRESLVSASPTTLPDGRPVRALTGTEVERLIADFGAAAARARAAGFDGVELQAGHGNLIHQFLSRVTNKRRDRFGRGPAGRLRLLRDVLTAMRSYAGDDFPIVVRISAAELIERGYDAARGQEIARAALAAGAAALHVSAGTPEAREDIPFCAGVGEATLAGLAVSIRAAVGPAVPIIASGRILSPETAEQLLTAGPADLVALGRALIADPAWPRKVAAGRSEEVWPCVGCMACQLPTTEPGIGCPINAESGHEAELSIAPAPQPRRVAVWGTGLPGLEVARVAALRGHEVTIYADGWPLGGLLGLRSVVPGLAEMGRAILAYATALKALAVPVLDGRPSDTDADVILDARPQPEQPPDWIGGETFWLASDVLKSDLRALIPLQRRVAICGDSSVTADVALFLAGWGKRPTIVTPNTDPLWDLHPTLAAHVRRRLEGYRIAVETAAEPIVWQPDAGPVRLGRSTGLLTVIQRGEQEDLGPFHSVVAAPGWDEHSLPALATIPTTIPSGGPPLLLGDSYRPDRWRDLTLHAARLARRL